MVGGVVGGLAGVDVEDGVVVDVDDVDHVDDVGVGALSTVMPVIMVGVDLSW